MIDITDKHLELLRRIEIAVQLDMKRINAEDEMRLVGLLMLSWVVVDRNKCRLTDYGRSCLEEYNQGGRGVVT